MELVAAAPGPAGSDWAFMKSQSTFGLPTGRASISFYGLPERVNISHLFRSASTISRRESKPSFWMLLAFLVL